MARFSRCGQSLLRLCYSTTPLWRRHCSKLISHRRIAHNPAGFPMGTAWMHLLAFRDSVTLNLPLSQWEHFGMHFGMQTETVVSVEYLRTLFYLPLMCLYSLGSGNSMSFGQGEQKVSSVVRFTHLFTCLLLFLLKLADFGCNCIHTSLRVIPMEHSGIYF